MSGARTKRSEKPVRIQITHPGKGKILKFDRRAGVILMEKTAPAAKSFAPLRLVRNLLRFLTPNGLRRNR